MSTVTAVPVQAAPFNGGPVPDVKRSELADEPRVGQPAAAKSDLAKMNRIVRGGYGRLGEYAAMVTDDVTASSALRIAAQLDTDSRNAVGVVCYKLMELGLTAKSVVKAAGLDIKEDSVLNRASLGRAIVVHRASAGQADEIAKGINRTHQRVEVRARLAADECDIPQLCAWIIDTRKAPAKPQASEDNGESVTDESAPQPAESAWFALAATITLAAESIRNGSAPADRDDVVAAVLAALDLVSASDAMTE